MSTSNQQRAWFEPRLAETGNKETKRSPAVPAGCGGSGPVSPERCMRCFTGLSGRWHARQVCDDCLEWEISQLRRQNRGSAE